MTEQHTRRTMFGLVLGLPALVWLPVPGARQGDVAAQVRRLWGAWPPCRSYPHLRWSVIGQGEIDEMAEQVRQLHGAEQEHTA